MTHRPSIALRIAWTSGHLQSSDEKVLQALASCGDWETGQRCYPRLATIATRAGLSISTVTRRLRHLEDPTQDGGPWIVASARRHRHSTTYDICTERLATGPPKEQQTVMTSLLAPPIVAAHFEQQPRSVAQNEQQDSGSVAQNEQPTGTPDLDQERTHTPRAREDAPTAPDLPLIGQTPPPKCLHPHAHAWCDGRVHVPRDLHFEFLDRLGARPKEPPAAKAGRLVAFYADTMTHLSPEASIGNAYAFWKGAYEAWIGTGARRQRARRSDGVTTHGLTCPHDPICTDGQCVARQLAEARAERAERSG